ncbi:MAG: Si-specific NAD(P)(+) transhydrogenase [Planctomycetota bacterium]|nr:Si-specific NAD(P)(+) transhydrogenase [Planctomycetota bacterium]
MRHYDCVVIGTGPAGQKAALQVSKLGKRVAIVERSNVVGGAQINTGTIPSKAMREAVLHLTGANQRGLFGQSYRVKRNITLSDLIIVAQQVMRHEWDSIRDTFDRHGIDLIWGQACFEGPNLLQIQRPQDSELITADKFIITTGTKPARPANVPFNDTNCLCSDAFLKLTELPKSVIVVGGGVIGTEYACIMATLGIRVILVEGRNQVLGFLDGEITEAFQYQMRQGGITLRLGEKVERITELPPEKRIGVNIEAVLESGKILQAEMLLYCVGRQGTTKTLGLDNVGLEIDDRERLKVNEQYQTAVPHVYAAGDVIGFPALASTAMEQGRMAACHAFGVPVTSMSHLFPYGIYALPEISMVGKTEQQLTEEGIPYEAGVARFADVARGQLLGDSTGMLKLLIHQESKQILGVHIMGTSATELIHLGQAVMSFGGTAEYFIQNVFNYPTLTEAYKMAAVNGMNKLQHT